MTDLLPTEYSGRVLFYKVVTVILESRNAVTSWNNTPNTTGT